MDQIRKRFPARNELLGVFGVAVFVCYGWTLLGFFNKLSSFLLHFTLAEIASIFAFMMAFALLESLAVTGILILASAVLPPAWLREGFAVKGFIILVIATVTSILFQKSLWFDYPPAGLLLLFSLIPLALTVALIGSLRFMPKVQNVLGRIQDRISIMLFVYVPIGLVAFVFVLLKNLL